MRRWCKEDLDLAVIDIIVIQCALIQCAVYIAKHMKEIGSKNIIGYHYLRSAGVHTISK